ncbi:MAG: histidinol dehydrogenase [Anaerolineales bacterium]|nr:histidinol dehydrogenase [Anaerolineales bacterium]MCB9126491.1 histidinol dehydrogenase [Ardenticatenales bacterium]
MPIKIVTPEALPLAFIAGQRDDNVTGVAQIVERVRCEGDVALRDFTQRYDGVTVEEFRVEPAQCRAAYEQCDATTISALQSAADALRRFAEVQKAQLIDFEVELMPGVFTGQRVLPIRRIGVYVPGGRFPLVSSLLMGAVPAQVAGVSEIALCSPPVRGGGVAPIVAAAAHLLAIDELYSVGGAQAIAALAYGSESIRPVDKIVGPGNAYVAEAKKLVFGTVGIDMIAGPTELLIIADESADPTLIAADLIAQAEHDVEARPHLITTSFAIATAVQEEVAQQLTQIETEAVARESLARHGLIVVVARREEAITLANQRAPEHLELQVTDPDRWRPALTNYGSLFIGELAAEVLGDYSAGINHTLPTSRSARYRGGLSVLDFLKVQSQLRLSDEGFAPIAETAERLALLEGLHGHFRAVERRRKGGE